jgi:hypothetical protein
VERTMRLMSVMVILGVLAACNSGSVTGPSVVGPGPGARPGPGPVGAADVQGSGVLARESRDVRGVARVRLHGVGHLIIEQGPAEALTITADDNILPLVTAEVYGDELVLGTMSGRTFASPNNIVFALTVADLDALAVLGAAGAEIRGLDADRLAIHLDGAAAVTASGRAAEQDVILSGVATYDARALDSGLVRLDVAGVSGAAVRVRERLEGRVDGQSTVEYIGQPVVAVEVAGGASVQRIDG